jgi:CDP-glycerol glycerophosphotransferase (TagB/SpsB family)
VPFFSVIVPAYNVQAYLRAAITSVLEQDFTDFEVIAVNDRSPDESGLIIDELAAQDSRVVAVHLAENRGLGGARNAGIDAASGDYLIFLDGDDTLRPGSLSAIAERLRTNDLPELCIYNYARTWWDGREAVSSASELLASLSVGTFVPREHLRLFNLLPIACNKAYRRDLVNSLHARFGPGFYEDVPFTYRVLMHANSAVTLNRVVLNYRQRREAGSILATPSEKHFDVFAQYDIVFSELASQGVDGRVWRHMYDIMVNHFVTILSKPDRVAPKDRPRFFEVAKESAMRHYRADAPGKNRPSAIRGKILREQGLGALDAYRRADRWRRGTRKAIGRVYWPVRRVVRKVRSSGRLMYRAARLLPLNEDLVVFSEYWGLGYGCNPRAIFEALPEVAPHLQPVWIISEERGRQLPPGTRQIRPRSWRQWPLFARAKFFVNNVNFPGGYVKRPGQVHIQTMHGTPLKYCGLDVLDTPAASSAVDPVRDVARSDGQVVAPNRKRVLEEYQDLLRRSDRWDYAVSSNPYSTEMWSHAYPCTYTWLEVGYPRNDALVNATDADIHAARKALGVGEGQTAVLYAPTFRETPGDVSVRFNVAEVAQELPESMVLIVRAHHTATAGAQVAELIAQGRIIDGSKVPDIRTCYLAADALITDYSSVMFDYALLDRPIIIYADDWMMYRETRGTYFDLIAEPPGLVAMNQRELVQILRSGDYRGSEAQILRDAFRQRFCVFDRGDAARRVIELVMLQRSV